MNMTIFSGVDWVAIEHETCGQTTTETWFWERVCRITASKMGTIFSCRKEFCSLARQHIYVSPPTSLPSLRFGRDKEPGAVALYQKRFPDREESELWTCHSLHREVPACGLVIHYTEKCLSVDSSFIQEKHGWQHHRTATSRTRPCMQAT